MVHALVEYRCFFTNALEIREVLLNVKHWNKTSIDSIIEGNLEEKNLICSRF